MIVSELGLNIGRVLLDRGSESCFECTYVRTYAEDFGGQLFMLTKQEFVVVVVVRL